MATVRPLPKLGTTARCRILYRLGGRLRSRTFRCSAAYARRHYLPRFLEQERRDRAGDKALEILPWGAFVAAYERWADIHKARTTRDRERAILANVQRRLSPHAPQSVTEADLRRYLSAVARDASPVTADRHLTFLRALFRWAVDRRYVDADANPAAALKAAPPRSSPPEFLSPDQVRAVVALATPRMADLIVWLVHTGARIGELVSADVGDVDLQRGVWRIRGATRRGTTKVHEREVPLSPAALAVARRWCREGRRGKGLRPARAPLCRSSRGQRLNRHSLGKFLRQAGRRLDLPFTLHPHVLRHTFGSQAAMAGVPLPTLSELMGHRTISSTLIYAHLSDPHRAEAVQRLGRVLGRPGHRRGGATRSPRHRS